MTAFCPWLSRIGPLPPRRFEDHHTPNGVRAPRYPIPRDRSRWTQVGTVPWVLSSDRESRFLIVPNALQECRSPQETVLPREICNEKGASIENPNMAEGG